MDSSIAGTYCEPGPGLGLAAQLPLPRPGPAPTLHTEDMDAVAQGLDSAGLDGHAECAGLCPLLGSLAHHDGQLVSDDGVQHGDDHHGENEGREGVDLKENTWTVSQADLTCPACCTARGRTHASVDGAPSAWLPCC